MTPRLLLQLAWLFHTEADAAVPDRYAWPPKRRPTDAEQAESARLHGIASELFDRAEALLPRDAETGIDAAFGVEGAT
jgi:hypothetical protein